MSEEEETVAAAAILVDGVIWTLPRPAYHSHVLRAYVDVNGRQARDEEQGFVTTTGRFVSREEAGTLCGWPGRRLLTEDLW